MKYFVQLWVHRHYVKTVVRERFGQVGYEERCISAPSAAHLLYDVKHKYWEEPFFDYDKTFPDFPYSAYLQISTIVDENTRIVSVQQAVYADNCGRGIKHFEDVFEDAPQDLTINVLKNIVSLIVKQDACKLMELIDTLSKASKHKAIKE